MRSPLFLALMVLLAGPGSGMAADLALTPQQAEPRDRQGPSPAAPPPGSVAGAPVPGEPCPGTEAAPQDQDLADRIAALKPFSKDTQYLSNMGFLRLCLGKRHPEYAQKTMHELNVEVRKLLLNSQRKGVKVAGTQRDFGEDIHAQEYAACLARAKGRAAEKARCDQWYEKARAAHKKLVAPKSKSPGQPAPQRLATESPAQQPD